MASDLLIHCTGVCALLLNVLALLRTCERSLRVQSGLAGVAWAFNNLLLGAHGAAALSLVSAGRTASSAVAFHAGARRRRLLCACFALLTVIVSVLTWHGWSSIMLLTASLISTYAVFYLQGVRLRCAMLVVSGLWMYHAWSHGSWEQMIANALTAFAALYGAWRADRFESAAARSDQPS